MASILTRKVLPRPRWESNPIHPLLDLWITEMMNEHKATKDSVDYSQGMPKSHCGICRYYEFDTQTCEKVRGHIHPDMWCKLWAPIEK